MAIVYRIVGDGIPKLNRAVDELGKETKMHRAYRLAINKVGKMAFTKVKRTLAKQTGLAQGVLIAKGGIRPVRASFSNLEFVIPASGSELSLMNFNAKQHSYGVSAKPWGKRRKFKSAFIFAGSPKSGQFVGGGHVFKRTSASSKPIEMMYGPSIPKELIKDETAKVFTTFGPKLRREVEQTIVKITNGVIS